VGSSPSHAVALLHAQLAVEMDPCSRLTGANHGPESTFLTKLTRLLLLVPPSMFVSGSTKRLSLMGGLPLVLHWLRSCLLREAIPLQEL
jgi:hypothetical protein